MRQPPILLITDRHQARRPLDHIVLAALRGGCRWASVREKDLPARDQVALARRLVDVALPFGARIMIHGGALIARDAGLGSVHLPASGDVRMARGLLGADAWISISTHGPAHIRAAADAGADAVSLSPIFATASKPGYGPFIGLPALAEAAAWSRIPIIALGGVEDGARVRRCLDAGATAIALMGAVMRADDPTALMSALVEAAAAQRGRSSTGGRAPCPSDDRSRPPAGRRSPQ